MVGHAADGAGAAVSGFGDAVALAVGAGGEGVVHVAHNVVM